MLKDHKDAYEDWLDYRGIPKDYGIEHVGLYRREYFTRWRDSEYIKWVDKIGYQLVSSEHIKR